MYFFASNIFPSTILFFYNSLIIIFQISNYSICNLYSIVGDISELHLLFHHLELDILDRILFWSKILFFQFSVPSVLQPYWKIWEFLKSQIPKNQRSKIVPGTESNSLVHLLLIHFWETFKVSIFRLTWFCILQ